MGFPDDTSSVEDAFAWWSSLDKDLQRAVLDEHADRLGRVGGIPIPVRSRCNEASLPRVHEPLRHQLVRLPRSYKRRREQIIELLSGVNDIERRLSMVRERGREAYLIDLDISGWGV